MPELPDVETFKRGFQATSLHRTISRVETLDESILQDITSVELDRQLAGREFEESRRHGKYLFGHVQGNGYVVFHFGMTGYLEAAEKNTEPPRHTRVLFHFEDGGSLAYISVRKFGYVSLTPTMEAFISEHGLGPDALAEDFDFTAFKSALDGKSSAIKSALMDQARIAGIGNDYSDEILFQAGVHPKRPADGLNEDQSHKLFSAMKQVLTAAIEAGADPSRMPDSFLLPHRKNGEPCPGCGGTVRAEKIAGRTAYYCPKCQS